MARRFTNVAQLATYAVKGGGFGGIFNGPAVVIVDALVKYFDHCFSSPIDKGRDCPTPVLPDLCDFVKYGRIRPFQYIATC